MMLIVIAAGAVDGGVLREDRDALLALEVHRVHDPLADGAVLGLVRGERAGLPEHGVDERGLAVVDVGDDRDVAEIIAGTHGHEKVLQTRVGSQDVSHWEYPIVRGRTQIRPIRARAYSS